MKIVELEIYNIRGIRHIKLEQNEKNYVIYGPNGSGKSTVVDAIDFLLTGNISRLTGEGTKNITLKKYGHNINSQPKEARVRAVFKLPGIDEQIELTRCMEEPKKLVFDESQKANIEPILNLAEHQQYILTRRDILRYITAKPSTRAQQIQELLNIQDVEKIRKNLVKIRNKFKTEYDFAEKTFSELKETIKFSISIEQFTEEIVLEFINEKRLVLGGVPLEILDGEELKKGTSAVSSSLKLSDTDLSSFTKAVQTITNAIAAENQEQTEKIDITLRDLLRNIKDDAQLLNDLSRFNLTEIGISMIDGNGNCPLCDKEWPPGELKDYLEKRMLSIRKVEMIKAQIEKLSNELYDLVRKITVSIKHMIEIVQKTEIEDISILQTWKYELDEFSKILNNPIELYLDNRFTSPLVKSILAPKDIFIVLDLFQQSIEARVVKLTPEQSAWDSLTILGEHLKTYYKRKTKIEETSKSLNKADILLLSFLTARDKILKDLYEKIKNRFIDLYKKIHGSDEKDFTADLSSDNAGLNFVVDFYGKGIHPPHALHSEGHQDSMGLCLYLALAEEINENLINFILLDDVIMSIDSDHRRAICKILNTCFPRWQFIITTHDKTWTNQLKSEGVVKSKDVIEFYNWNIDTGPLIMDYKINIWDQIFETLSKGDIPSAAFQLRRGLEQFFRIVCDSLRAPIPYKLSGRHDLGDFLNAGVIQYQKLLKKAIKSARYWENDEKIEELNAYQTEVNQIYERTKAEYWAVNTSVHYNTWPELTENDFHPVVDAFNDLYQLFLCSNCGGIKQVLKDSSLKETTVICNCGEFNWNLKKK